MNEPAPLDPPCRTFKLTIEYDGRAYAGWQYQVNGPSLQGLLEDKLAILVQMQGRLMGASRTDAGVHAFGQVISFRAVTPRTPQDLMFRMNAILPADVAVRAASVEADDFHARYSARGKRYRYQLWNARERSVFLAPFAWHVTRPLDVPAMKRAAALLVGEHDFSAFRAKDCQAKHAVRMLRALEVDDSRAPLVCIEAQSRAFLKHMVRNLVGTLVDVGRGKRTPEDVTAILESRDRTRAGRTAPAHGLCLLWISYDDDDRPPPERASSFT